MSCSFGVLPDTDRRPPGPLLSHASVSPADLDALNQLFQKDPATAFEKSWKMFQEPRKKGDLEGMTENFVRDRHGDFVANS